jgi:DNA-binding CsgD family transcriptional regulator
MTHGNYVLRRTITNAIPWIDYHQGRPEAVRQHIRQFLTGGLDSLPGSFVLPDALVLQQLGAMLAIDEGSHAEAGRWLASNRRWLEWSGSVPGWSEHWMLQARLLQETGRMAEAMDAANRAVGCAERPLQPLARLQALRTRGILRGARGDVSSARADLREALMLADACAAPFERALTLVALAEATSDLSGLDDAEGVASRLRAAALLARIVAVRGGARRETDLTARELDVLRLAAQGLTDAEIGERLFISHRTVGQHLRSVYGKLEVHSRAAATRYAVERQLV